MVTQGWMLRLPGSWAVTSSADVKSAALDYQLYFKFLPHISYNQWNEGRLYFTALHKQFAPAGS